MHSEKADEFGYSKFHILIRIIAEKPREMLESQPIQVISGLSLSLYEQLIYKIIVYL